MNLKALAFGAAIALASFGVSMTATASQQKAVQVQKEANVRDAACDYPPNHPQYWRCRIR